MTLLRSAPKPYFQCQRRRDTTAHMLRNSTCNNVAFAGPSLCGHWRGSIPALCDPSSHHLGCASPWTRGRADSLNIIWALAGPSGLGSVTSAAHTNIEPRSWTCRYAPTSGNMQRLRQQPSRRTYARAQIHGTELPFRTIYFPVVPGDAGIRFGPRGMAAFGQLCDPSSHHRACASHWTR